MGNQDSASVSFFFFSSLRIILIISDRSKETKNRTRETAKMFYTQQKLSAGSLYEEIIQIKCHFNIKMNIVFII